MTNPTTPIRTRIYVAVGSNDFLIYPVKIVESGNMRTIFVSDDLKTAQDWIKANGYIEAHAPYYSKKVTEAIMSGKAKKVLFPAYSVVVPLTETPAPVAEATAPAAATAPKAARKPRQTEAQKYIAKLEDMDTPAILKVLKAEGFSHLISPADYGEIHNWALEILLRNHFGIEAVALYQKARNARYQVAPAFETREQPAAPAQNAPATATIESAMTVKLGIAFPVLDNAQHGDRVKIEVGSNVCMECGHEIVRPYRPVADCLFCNRRYSHAQEMQAIKAQPDSTVSPALVTPVEQVIAVPTIAPMALSTRTLSINGTHVRVTTITAKSFAIEELSAGGYGGFENVGNYATQAQVDNAIARIARESQPAPVVTAPTKPAAIPDNFTPERIAAAKVRMEQADLDYQAFHAQMADKRESGTYRGGHKQTRALTADSEKLHNLLKQRQQAATSYMQLVHLAEQHKPASAPVGGKTAPAATLTPALLEGLKVLSHVPRDYDISALTWQRPTTERDGAYMYRISERVGEGLIALGLAVRNGKHFGKGIEITEAGRKALAATFASSSVNSKTGGDTRLGGRRNEAKRRAENKVNMHRAQNGKTGGVK